jgi:hypothetical protein
MYGKGSGACHSPGHLQTFRSVDSSAGIQTRSDRSATSGLPLPASPNPIAARPDGGRVLSRVGVADHAVLPDAPWTGSGWREYSYGGFGGGQPHFLLHGDYLRLRVSSIVARCLTSTLTVPAMPWQLLTAP